MRTRPLSRAHHIARCLKAAGRADLFWMKQFDHCETRGKAETTATMLCFDDETHALRILQDSHGFLTVAVRERPAGTLLHTVRFRKWQCGQKTAPEAVYRFRDTGRLWSLAVEPSAILPPDGTLSSVTEAACVR